MHSRSTGVATEACIVQFALPARANYAKHSRPLLYGMPNCSSNSRPTVYASFHNCHGFYQVVNFEIAYELANSRRLCLLCWFWSLDCVSSKQLFCAVRRRRVAAVHEIMWLPHVQPPERGLRLARQRPQGEGRVQGKQTQRELKMQIVMIFGSYHCKSVESTHS